MKKTNKLMIRVADGDKTKLRAAAKADGRSLSSFVLRSALAAAAELQARK